MYVFKIIYILFFVISLICMLPKQSNSYKFTFASHFYV